MIEKLKKLLNFIDEINIEEYNQDPKCNVENRYEDSILVKFRNLINTYDNLKKYRLTNSVIDDRIIEFEEKINEFIKELIVIFTKLAKGD